LDENFRKEKRLVIILFGLEVLFIIVLGFSRASGASLIPINRPLAFEEKTHKLWGMSNATYYPFVPPKLMWLLKSPLDQNTIMIYHKFNGDFKSHINFGGTKG
jgi:hypothetical protein